MFDDVFPEVTKIIIRLEQRGLKRIQDFSREDAQIMERAFLFYVYHYGTMSLPMTSKPMTKIYGTVWRILPRL